MTVPFKELAGSPVEVYGPGTVKAQRRILCAWEDRAAMIAEILGSAYGYGDVWGAIYPGNWWVMASGVKVEPFEARPDDQGTFSRITSQLNSYSGQFAELTVDYELMPSASGVNGLAATEGGSYLTYRMSSSTEELFMSAESLRWQYQEAASVPAESVPVLRVPIVAHHVTWHRVTQPPWDTIRATLGSVNTEAFLGAPAETLLFESAGAERQFVNFDDTRQPQFAWRLHYIFRERALRTSPGAACGWNHAYRSEPASAPGFERLLTSAGTPLYRAGNFSGLFQLDSGSE